MKYYLAVDIGASSGRHILSHKENGKIILEEIFRFENNLQKRKGHLCWNVDYLFESILTGMKECKKIGKLPESIAIDTWAVDFVLLNKDDDIVSDSVAYRDSRTEGISKTVEELISFENMYKRTGIQKQDFNTVYQLMALKKESPKQLLEAESFLMIPDYLNFLLCGIKTNEYTNATSTSLVNAENKDWDFELIEMLGLPKKMFMQIKMPKTILGGLKQSIKNEVGFDCNVILPATHDTGSAFLAVPAKDDNAVYISSGTWSLLGVENNKPITNNESMKQNFTNEGGYDYRFRFLKNIMGLWMIQSVKRELGKEYSFSRLENEAKNSDYNEIIDVNDTIFLAPESMIEAIKKYCEQNEKCVPVSVGDIIKCIYLGLAVCYKNAIKSLEKILGKKFTSINIVGGGSKDSYLNSLTATATGLPVYAGPTEGTALGNLMVQMILAKEFENLNDARSAIEKSFEIKEYR